MKYANWIMALGCYYVGVHCWIAAAKAGCVVQSVVLVIFGIQFLGFTVSLLKGR